MNMGKKIDPFTSIAEAVVSNGCRLFGVYSRCNRFDKMGSIWVEIVRAIAPLCGPKNLPRVLRVVLHM